MNRRLLIIVSSALVLSICASYLVYRAFRTQVNVGKPTPVVQVVMAARDLEVGALVRDSDLRTVPWTGPLPKGASAKRDGFLNRGVSAAIYDGEPMTENRLSSRGSGGGLAATIPPGMRACAVKVNEVVGVAGFVVPGMRVDVLITGLPPGGDPLNGPRARTLLQNIQVLSAGVNFQKDAEGKPEQAQVVNLLVTPAQAEILSLASNETHIQLVLRNPMDTQIAIPPGTVMSDLFGTVRASSPGPVSAERGLSPRKAVKAAQVTTEVQIQEAQIPRPYVVEISNGSAHTQARFTLAPEKQ
jgi:pilus assembly protein CpaB